jgi:hypothetical protein
LFFQDHCAGQVVYWSNAYTTIPMTQQASGTIMVPMQLDGKEVDVGLESAETGSTMLLSAASRIFGIDEKSPGMSSTDDPRLLKYSFGKLSANGLDITNPHIVIVKDNPTSTNCKGQSRFSGFGETISKCYGSVDVRLGIPELRQLHLYLSFKEKTLYLTSADAH